MKKLKKLELSPQNSRYDILHLLYSVVNECEILNMYFVGLSAIANIPHIACILSWGLGLKQIDRHLCNLWVKLYIFPVYIPSPTLRDLSVVNSDFIIPLLAYFYPKKVYFRAKLYTFLTCIFNTLQCKKKKKLFAMKIWKKNPQNVL